VELAHTNSPVYLEALKSYECVDWDKEQKTVEVLAFSRARVLITTAKIFSGTTVYLSTA